MKYNPKLVDALYKTADLLESEWGQNNYNHGYSGSCNLGVLAQILIKNEPNSSVLAGVDGFWCDSANVAYSHCSSTGIPLQLLFRVLHFYGLEQKDYADIEFCGLHFDSDSAMLNNADIRYSDRFFAANYLRQKARQLENQILPSIKTQLNQSLKQLC